jgi:hypothetical protein
MKQEPVAWIKNNTLILLNNYSFKEVAIPIANTKTEDFDIPLYTTPRQLSDEEIIELAVSKGWILIKKAIEK